MKRFKRGDEVIVLNTKNDNFMFGHGVVKLHGQYSRPCICGKEALDGLAAAAFSGDIEPALDAIGGTMIAPERLVIFTAERMELLMKCAAQIEQLQGTIKNVFAD